MSSGDHVINLDSSGLKRRYVIHLPAGDAGDRPLPVVVMMDGRGGTPWTAMKSSGWSHKADTERFIAVYPEAQRLIPSGPQHFMDNPQMWKTEAGSIDVEFLRAVIADVIARFHADPQRVYLAGFSNGAVMAFRFAIESPELVAAIAPVAGHFRIRDTVLRTPVPMIYFFGKQDPLSPFAGGMIELPWGPSEPRPPVVETPARWAALLGITEPPTIEERPDGVTVTRYGDLVEFYAIDGLGHVWPGGHRLLPENIVGVACDKVKATDVIWPFFKSLVSSS
ncbi:MAG: PHB depolymerase family esterase [bacterium]